MILRGQWQPTSSDQLTSKSNDEHGRGLEAEVKWCPRDGVGFKSDVWSEHF